MSIELERTSLLSTVGDHEGALAYRDGQLIAVLSCLSELHEELEGHWFVEAAFGNGTVAVGQWFRSLDDFKHAATRAA